MHKIHKFFSKSLLSVHSEGTQNSTNALLYDCDKADSEPEYSSSSSKPNNKANTVNTTFLSNLKKSLIPRTYSSSESVTNSNDQYSSTEDDTESQSSGSFLNKTSSFVRSLESPSSWQFISPSKTKTKSSKAVNNLHKKFAVLTQLSDCDEAIEYCEKLFLRKQICTTVEDDPKHDNEKKLRCVLASCVEILVIFDCRFEQCRSMSKDSFYVILKLKFLSGNLKIFNSLASQIQYFFERSPYASKNMLYQRFNK